MEPDPVVAEVRAIREQLAARLGFRIPDIVKEAQRQDAVGDRKVVRLRPRHPIAVGGVTQEPGQSYASALGKRLRLELDDVDASHREGGSR